MKPAVGQRFKILNTEDSGAIYLSLGLTCEVLRVDGTRIHLRFPKPIANISSQYYYAHQLGPACLRRNASAGERRSK